MDESEFASNYETVLEDLDFMVEQVRENRGIITFLSITHSATALKNALEKQLSKPVVMNDNLDENHAYCPSCKAVLGLRSHQPFNNCPCCGQRVEWWGNNNVKFFGFTPDGYL